MENAPVWQCVVALVGLVVMYAGGFLVGSGNERSTAVLGSILLAAGAALVAAGVLDV